jgi:hypothetical protein
MSQPPQWALLAWVLAQVPPQAISLAAQQMPAEQRPAHGEPHAPQLFRSDVRSTQAPPQFVWPAGQHLPAEHFAPAQSPSSQQSELAMQPAPHFLKPASHWKPQVPSPPLTWHLAEPFVTPGQAAQLLPQELTLVSERQRPPQSCVPAGQTPMHDWPSGMHTLAHGFWVGGQLEPHFVPSQVAVPPWGAAHAEHDVPQLAGERSSAQVPLQAWRPMAHVNPQRWLLLQVTVPFATAGQSAATQQPVLGMHSAPHFW